MDLKNAMGIANVMAIFGELSKEAKQTIIQDWINAGEISTMQWQNATKNKPAIGLPVFGRGGVYKEPLTRMVVWDGEKWHYYDYYVEVETISDFCIP